MESGNEKKFWGAIQDGDAHAVRLLLAADKSLAGKNFEPESLHTNGFPLFHATKQGNVELVNMLLDAGADPDAKLDVEEPREVGMPLIHALEHNDARASDYEIVHLLLDHSPSLNAYPYCSTPFVDCLFNNMWDTDLSYQPGEVWKYKRDSADEVASLFRRSFQGYFETDHAHVKEKAKAGDAKRGDDFPEMRLLQRVIGMGGQASFFTLVRHEQHPLIEGLLRNCPEESGTLTDWPQSSVLGNIRGPASWCGYPKTIESCMVCCPELYDADSAKHTIEAAIRSHNRDGDIDQYYELIEGQLLFLKEKSAVNERYENGDPFCPLHWLAEDFIEPSHYGFKCARLGTEDDIVRLAKLFIEYGFDIDSVNPKTEMNVLATAKSKKRSVYVEFLQSR